MKHTFKKLASLLLIGMLTAGTAQAQVPQKFNYQGIARDAKGNPIAKQQMALKLSVLPTADASIPEYEETQMVNTNDFGLYTLQIGNGTVIAGDMKTVKWETGNKYIKVAIDPKGGTEYAEMGTTQLLSVPYAIYADKAGSATESTTKGTRAGGVTTPIGSTGATNYLAKFTGPNEIDKSNLLIVANSLIMDGPLNSANHHLIREGGLNRGYYGSYIGSGAPFPTPIGSSDADVDMGTSGSNPTGKLHLSTVTKPRLTVLPTSQIGINTTLPSLTTQLDVNGTGSTSLGTAAMATGIHATANQSNVLTQTNRASIGGYKESIAILGEGKATNPTASTINLGVAGMANTANKYNVGVQGEAKNGLVDNIGVLGAGNGSSTSNFTAGVLGEINTVGTGATSVNYAVAGSAPIVAAGNSWAGYFQGKVKIKDGSQANNFIFTSDANGTGTWMDPSTNPLFASSVNDWHVTGNTVSATDYVGTNNDFPLRFKVFGNDAGHIENNKENAYYGYRAGEANLPLAGTGIRNTGIGDFALRLNTTGDGNTALGRNALASNVTSKWNTAVGTSSLENNVSEANTAVGLASMNANTTGGYNTAQGAFALFVNTTGNGNVATGANAMQKNTIGSNNTAVGVGASFENVDGNNNTALGSNALNKNVGGISNVAIGSGAAYNNQTSDNLAIGVDALFTNNIGTRNVAIGNNALNQNTDNDNTALGAGAMKTSTTGEQNTAVGSGSMSLANGGYYNTAVGVVSLRKNQGIYNTGLGWKTLQDNTTGSYNNAVGVQALGSNTTGGNNVAMGHNALYNNTTGSLNTALGFRAGETAGISSTQATAVGSFSAVGSNSTNATAIGSKAYAPNNNTVILGSINGVNGATANTRTGIGTTAPTSTLHNAGSFSIAWRTSQISGVDVLGDLDHVINIANGASASIQLPDPTTCPYREYIIVNQNSVTRTIMDVLGNGYWNFSGSNVTIIPANSSISVIAAPGGSWNRIR
jgi:hypothetical protein